MPKSVFTGAHGLLVEVLVAARKESGLTQAELAAKVRKDQTYISIIERSQRRVDVLEFCALARAMARDPKELFALVVDRLPDELEV
ncbi:MAG: helix-turn-helix transcriptional regulator [Phenylobacterium sp.]|uniref:helix-turn-helix domain-containing protein n=1 Tax=Phenylobacterium sp. TaxID=1871053 RepID=UPI0027339F7C|nr:helix-turn-helix transcriptional regulator [Phenylobacterium sp.]MDP3749707.1 helix-turn-helix transcriptional regulator [Phenylobacterium sp.]